MKMFKKTKYIGLLLSAAIGFSACDSYLEEENYENVTSESFISQDNADQLVVGMYKSLRDIYRKAYDARFMGTDIFTQQGELFSFNSLNEYYNINASDGNFGDIWERNYSLITKANTVINRYSNEISWDNAGEAIRDNGIAQAQALRALAYFNLIQQFGGVPLTLDETTSIRDDYSRASEQECYTQIIADLEAAIPILEITPEETGRFSRRAAQHVLAEVYLTRGYKSFGSSSDFTTAAGLAESAIGSYDIRSQSFAELFDYDNQENDEILFAVQYGNGIVYDDRNNNKHSLFKNSVNDYLGIGRTNDYGRSNSSVMPTEYFYALFDANDTRDEVTLHRALIANETATYTSDNGSEVINPGDTVVYYPKVALDAVELADKMNRYFVYQPDQYYYGIPTEISGALYQYSTNLNRTNFPIFKKFDDRGFDESEGGYRDTYVFRVAGTHLLAAEAHLQAGNTAEALAHINVVRERATGVANHYAAVTIDNILDERAIELAGEENRWAVLKRTGKLEERLQYNPHAMDHGTFDANVHLLRPIPEHEMDLSNGSLEQNPGY